MGENITGLYVASVIKPMVQTTKYRESLLSMLNNSLMAINPKGSPKAQITYGLKHTCLSASVGTIKQIKRR